MVDGNGSVRIMRMQYIVHSLMRNWKTRYKALLAIAIIGLGNFLFLYAWTHASLGPVLGNLFVILDVILTGGGAVYFLIVIIDKLQQ